MIYTSSHNKCKSNRFVTVAISGNRGKDANYQGKCYPKLAHKFSFWKIWHENIGKIPEMENNKFYIEEYWKQVLSKLDPEEVYKELDNSILLCYEPNFAFCHRHIVSAWLEITLGIEVLEVSIVNENIKIENRPNYIKSILEEIMLKKSLKLHKKFVTKFF